MESLFLTSLNSIVVEYQSDAADNDDEYDVQSDDESVIIFQTIFFFYYCHTVIKQDS